MSENRYGKHAATIVINGETKELIFDRSEIFSKAYFSDKEGISPLFRDASTLKMALDVLAGYAGITDFQGNILEGMEDSYNSFTEAFNKLLFLAGFEFWEINNGQVVVVK